MVFYIECFALIQIEVRQVSFFSGTEVSIWIQSPPIAQLPFKHSLVPPLPGPGGHRVPRIKTSGMASGLHSPV